MTFSMTLQGAVMSGSEVTTRAPVKLDIPSAIVSSQSLPAVLSLDSLAIIPTTVVDTKTSLTLSRSSALLAAIGLSLIPTLAVSIPFFMRRGRHLNLTIPELEQFQPMQNSSYH